MSRKRPFLIGLTGSIGMGKSTTAALFANEGIPVWDADKVVHRLYEKDGAGVAAIRRLYPDAVIDDMVSRAVLRDRIAKDPNALGRIEAAILPLLAKDRARFIDNCASPIAVLDMPTLLETGADKLVDLVVVVSVPPDVQRARVMERPGMTETQLNVMLARQMPDAEKRARADHVIQTLTLEGARASVQSLVDQIKRQLSDA
ncbi:dephospho-CoA kinase [Pseudogemmobacter sp. W21_MBD1_M6]|uniref:dephospho-CoA kinase n=1 Tax=Pseudogemmobacter sp. W21_MBD1_M6 TaxID=3240271 RepID=UPI003F987376